MFRDVPPSLAARSADIASGTTDRGGMCSTDPELQIAATALVGLWPIQFHSLARHLDSGRTPGRVQAAVSADVHRAAQLLQTGLNTFATTRQRPRGAAGYRRP